MYVCEVLVKMPFFLHFQLWRKILRYRACAGVACPWTMNRYLGMYSFITV
jgi:hypothetical protein